MWILGVNRSHDAAICLMKDNEIVLSLQEERLTHVKYDREVFHALDLVAKYTDVIDLCAYTHLYNTKNDFGPYFKYIKKIGIKVERYVEAKDYHHSLHAACGYYNSGFDEAGILVIDGAGADHPWGKENETIFKFTQDPNAAQCLYQKVIGYENQPINNAPPFVDDKRSIGVGFVYSGITEYLGWDSLECGKTMGISSYGEPNDKIKSMISDSGGNTDRFALADFNEHKNVMVKMRPYDYISYSKDADDKFKRNADLAWKLQNEFEEYVYQRIMATHRLSGSNNVIFTGGCALNCVANYRILKRLPKEINLYVEPMSADCGVAMGAAYITYAREGKAKYKKKKLRPLKNLYHGQPLRYHYELQSNEFKVCEVTPSRVAELISEGNVVAIAQGKSENGPRALGNRSILYDPRAVDGKDVVNKVKKREYWRPFAGTVLADHAQDWFDMDRLYESPHMMYAVDVLKSAVDQIPCITHVDNTCRIQTLTEEQNPNYYKLIEAFYHLTGVPILFNTSFNLAGDTIVETIEDALKTMRESEICYLYLPEKSELLFFPDAKESTVDQLQLKNRYLKQLL